MTFCGLFYYAVFSDGRTYKIIGEDDLKMIWKKAVVVINPALV